MNFIAKFKSQLLVSKLIFVLTAIVLAAGFFVSAPSVRAEANWFNTFQYYTFDTLDNPTVWPDSSLNGFNIDHQLSPASTTPGRFGNASYYSYNQNYTYGYSGPQNAHAFVNNGYSSISFWYRLNEDLSQNPYFISGVFGSMPYKVVWSQNWCTNADYAEVHLGNIDGSAKFKVQFLYDIDSWNNNLTFTSGELPADQAWHNIVIVWKNNHPADSKNGIWVDGVKDAGAQSNGNLGFPLNTRGTDIGCYTYLGPYNIFNIAIDDLAIVKKDITPAQVALLQTESFGDMLGPKSALPIPIVTDPGQFQTGGLIPLAENETSKQDSLTIQAMVVSPNESQVELQVEIQPAGTPFTGNPTATGNLFSSEKIATILIDNLPNGRYRWQVRAIDPSGNASDWQTAAANDFTVDYHPVSLPFTGTPVDDNFDFPNSWAHWGIDAEGDHYSQYVCDNYSSYNFFGITDQYSRSSPRSMHGSIRLDYNRSNCVSEKIAEAWTIPTDGTMRFYFHKEGNTFPVLGAYLSDGAHCYPDSPNLPGVTFGDNGHAYLGEADNCNYTSNLTQADLGEYDHVNWNQVDLSWNSSDHLVGLSLNGGPQYFMNYDPRLNWNRILWLGFADGDDESVDDISFRDNTILPPAISNLSQFEFNGTTAIAEGGNTSGSTVIFQGILSSPSGNPAQLQVEVKPTGTALTGTPTATSVFSSTWGIVSVSVPNLPTGQYHWQARVVDSQNNASAWQEFGTAGNVDFTIAQKSIIVPVVLAEFNNYDHNSGPITAQPCKLIPKKVYQKGHDKEYYTDLFYCVKDYFCENSFGKRNALGICENGLINFNFEITDKWYRLTKNKEDYKSDESGRKENKLVNDVASIVPSLGSSTVSIVVGAGDSSQLGGYFDTLMFRDGRILVAENDGIYFFSHELVHFLGKEFLPSNETVLVPDLYEMGQTQGWDIMSNADLTTKDDPMMFGSYIREFLHWFEYDTHGINQTGQYWIKYLEESEYGNRVFRYNLAESSGEDVEKYYIIEARDKNLMTWDSSIPRDKSVVLYYVDENGAKEYGYSNDGLTSLNSLRTVSVPGMSGSKIDFINSGVLTPNQALNDTYRDYDSLVKITAKNEENINGKSGVNVDVERITKDSLSDNLWGMVLKDKTRITKKASYASFNQAGYVSDSQMSKEARETAQSMVPAALALLGICLILFVLNRKISARLKKFKGTIIVRLLRYFTAIGAILFLLAFLVIFSLMVSLYISFENRKYLQYIDVLAPSLEENISYPSTDLHLYCDDGRHVGMNYKTGEYEIGVVGAETAGDSHGSPEWIFVPESLKGHCSFVASSRNTQQFILENQDIVSEIGLDNIKNNYEIYAREMNKTTGIVTSASVAETIDPGRFIKYDVVDDDDGSLSITPGVIFEKSKPTISVILPQEGQEIAHDEKLDIAYFADDNFSGIATSTAKIYLDGQVISSNTIDLFKQSLGAHQIKITIQDLAGNQAEQTVNFSVITDIDGTIADVNRAYDEKMITKNDAKKGLINDLNDIKAYQERYGQKIQREKALRDKAMAQCFKHKNQAWCTKKIGTIFDRFEYQLNKIDQAFIKLKYSLILTKLDVYLKTKWLNQAGYNIIKEDIKYLISKM
jgi:hypothetical protein